MRTRGAGRDVDAINKRRNIGEEITLRRNVKCKTTAVHLEDDIQVSRLGGSSRM